MQARQLLTEDLIIGDVQRYCPGKTTTEYDDHLFCVITMNHQPLHANGRFVENETFRSGRVRRAGSGLRCGYGRRACDGAAKLDAYMFGG